MGEGLTIIALFLLLFQVNGPSTGGAYIKVGGLLNVSIFCSFKLLVPFFYNQL